LILLHAILYNAGAEHLCMCRSDHEPRSTILPRMHAPGRKSIERKDAQDCRIMCGRWNADQRIALAESCNPESSQQSLGRLNDR
jgi:hypothetical protein